MMSSKFLTIQRPLAGLAVTVSLALGLLGLFSASTASAVPLGPVYPPPGGVTFSSSGAASIGASGGRTFHFSGFDLNQSDNLYWGAASATAVGLALDGAINSASEFITLGILSTGVAGGTGLTQISTTTGTFNVLTSFRLTVRDLSNNLVNLITTGSVGLGFGGVLVDVDSLATNGFTAQLEGFAGNNFNIPLDQYFTQVQTTGGSSRSSFQGGFFYNELTGGGTSQVSEAATLGLFGLGLVGLGFTARRRKTA